MVGSNVRHKTANVFDHVWHLQCHAQTGRSGWGTNFAASVVQWFIHTWLQAFSCARPKTKSLPLCEVSPFLKSNQLTYVTNWLACKLFWHMIWFTNKLVPSFFSLGMRPVSIQVLQYIFYHATSCRGIGMPLCRYVAHSSCYCCVIAWWVSG